MDITMLSIDIAKNVFQVCGVDKSGQIGFEKKVSRAQLLITVNRFPGCTVVMEACSSSHYWAREFTQRGHTVKLIAPQYVKPFVQGNKTDLRDARAIAEAGQRPSMPTVSVKTVEQQDMQALLRIREGYIEMRTQVVNQIRGLLAEYGVIVSQSIYKLRSQLPALFDREIDNGLIHAMKGWMERQYASLLMLDENIAWCDVDINGLVKQHEACQRLLAIEGVGKITALAIVASIGDGSAFKNGRHFAAFVGLVPRQHSSGDKQLLLGISKRGDKFIRKLLIHGGRAVVQHAVKKTDSRSTWINRLHAERGHNKAVVAVANKNARIILALLKKGEMYRKAA